MTLDHPATLHAAANRRASKVKRGRAIKSAFAWLLAAVYLFPVYWMINTSFKTSVDMFATPPQWIPKNLHLGSYAAVFSDKYGIPQAFGNSLIIGVATTSIALVVGVFTAYALARVEFPGKGAVTGIILAASMFPGIALVTPLFQLFSNIGWIGTYRAMIIPNISFVLPLTVYTLTSFFRELPWKLEEAARVDGASRGLAFRKVILPLAAPALFTTAILAFIATWNEFMLSNQLSNTSTEPVTVAIARFSGASAFEFPYAATMAAGALVTVPLVIMVLVFQRRIVSGLTSGGVK